jgi:asparagine synthase (glutamine-hydrolysing)
MIPTYYVSKVAREYVTVALSGDGGDELFGGYNWYSWSLRLDRLERYLGPISPVLAWTARALPQGIPGRHLVSSLGQERGYQFLQRVACFQNNHKSLLYSPDFARSLAGYDFGKEVRNKFMSYGGDLLQRMTKTDFHYYLPEDILTKVDRASMAVSLEARVPWLDHRLVEFAFSLPSEMRIKNGRKKHLPKELARRLLPPNLLIERKRGFCIPLDAWLRGELGKMLDELLLDDCTTEYLREDGVLNLLKQQRADLRSCHGFQLFAVLMFLIWHQRYVAN